MNCSNEKNSAKHREFSKRGAAGIAATTKGRSRVFKDKSKYDRKTQPKAGF